MHEDASKALTNHQRPRFPMAIRPAPAFYNVAETAEIMRLDQSTMYRHLRSGKFPAVKIGGRYVVPCVVVEHLINAVLDAGTCVDIAQWTTRWAEESGVSAGGGA